MIHYISSKDEIKFSLSNSIEITENLATIVQANSLVVHSIAFGKVFFDSSLLNPCLSIIFTSTAFDQKQEI